MTTFVRIRGTKARHRTINPPDEGSPDIAPSSKPNGHGKRLNAHMPADRLASVDCERPNFMIRFYQAPKDAQHRRIEVSVTDCQVGDN